jgi:hypothetical protein
MKSRKYSSHLDINARRLLSKYIPLLINERLLKIKNKPRNIYLLLQANLKSGLIIFLIVKRAIAIEKNTSMQAMEMGIKKTKA